MSLDKWLAKSGCYCEDVNGGCKLVFLGRVPQGRRPKGSVADMNAALWDLVDYVVSSVCGERVYLVARKAG